MFILSPKLSPSGRPASARSSAFGFLCVLASRANSIGEGPLSFSLLARAIESTVRFRTGGSKGLCGNACLSPGLVELLNFPIGAILYVYYI